MTILKLYILIILSNTTNIDKINIIYNLSFNTKELTITSAIILYETGRMSCNNCALTTHNNLTGFMWKNKYIRYNNYNECVKAYNKWQIKRYLYYKNKYPNDNYYQFLEYIYYCDNPKEYIKMLKYIIENG